MTSPAHPRPSTERGAPRGKAALLVACALLAGRPAAAADGPSSGSLEHGKLGTSDASPVGAGALEVEIGFAPASSFGSKQLAGWDSRYAVSAAATYGLSQEVDLRVASGFARGTQAPGPPGELTLAATGIVDTVAALRWRFLADAARGAELALLATLVVPTGVGASSASPGFSQEHWSGGGALVATKDWDRSTANLEVGLDAPLAGDAGERRLGWFVNVAAGWQLSSWVQPELELNYAASLEGSLAQSAAVTAGLLLPLPDGVRLALGASTEVWNTSAEPAFKALLAVKVPVLR